MNYSILPRAVRFWLLATIVASVDASVGSHGPRIAGGSPAAWAAEPAQSRGEAREIWEAFYLQNAKIGYGQLIIRPVQQAGKALVRIDSVNRLTISRFGQRTSQDLKTSTWETPDGRLLEFTTEVSFGPTPTLVRGRVDGKQMVIETETKGSKQTSKIPWSDEVRGFRAVEQSLEQQPIKSGEKRKLKMLMPLVNQIATVELVGRDLETTSVLGVKTKLMRIETVANLPDGNLIASTMWTDAQGQTIKTRVQAMQQESFRTSKDLAMSEQPAGATFDLGLDVIVKPDKPLTAAHATRQARYQVDLVDGDPAKIFATGTTQSVRSLGPHSAEVTVRSVRPGDVPPVQTTEPVARLYTAANNVLQIDDPRIKAMAQEARGDAKTPAQVVVALEKYVNAKIAKKNFSQTFATAAEVAETREGDCTEHAVLLAALARACGIPSRVAVGLVYVESALGFCYHMWTEVDVNNQWIPLDATLGRGGIGAAHLKLTDSSLDGAAAYSAFLPVANVVGQLKIKVLSAE